MMNTKITANSEVSFRIDSNGGLSSAPEQRRYLVSLYHWLPLPCLMALVLCLAISSSSHAQAEDQQKLESLLRRYPEADADKDGKPTKGDPARWEETIKQFEATDAATPPPKGGVLLVGGSNARRWTNVSEYFPQHRVINRGFGGARLTDVLHYTHRIVLPYAPKTILLNAGGNDLSSGKTPEQICDAARAFITKVHAALPETRIYCIGVPPVRRASATPDGFNTIRALNALMADLARTEKNVEFIDLFPAFLDEKGQHRAELFVEDGTHFNAKGYQTLTDLLRGKF